MAHVSLFERADPPRQLRALVDYVMEPGNVVSTDISIFEDRLQRYASKAGITLAEARQNVRLTCGNALDSNLIQFGLK
jgi:hypothetical protein